MLGDKKAKKKKVTKKVSATEGKRPVKTEPEPEMKRPQLKEAKPEPRFVQPGTNNQSRKIIKD